MNAELSRPVDDWLRIAYGEAKMPIPFQRFIAAWVVVDWWYRTSHPEDPYGSNLKADLTDRLRNLSVSEDDDWRSVLDDLQALGTVRDMSGSHTRDTEHCFSGPEDWENIVEVLYTIRCNLVHGGKHVENTSDLKWATKAAPVVAMIACALTRSDAASAV